MIKPYYWPRYQRTRWAVANYPLYDAPHKQAEGTLPRDQIDENFSYFMAMRLERLTFFQKWLSDRFRIETQLNGEGVLALEKWADRYAGGLVTSVEESSSVFTTYRPSWTGDRCGYNVLIDIAIFIGEFLISRRSNLHWTPLTDGYGGLADGKEGEGIGSTLGRPALGGFSLPRWSPDLLQSIYCKMRSSRNRLEFDKKPRALFHADLASICRQYLHVATHRDPQATFTFGDYRHGPL